MMLFNMAFTPPDFRTANKSPAKAAVATAAASKQAQLGHEFGLD